jgi:hypothetical protein
MGAKITKNLDSPPRFAYQDAMTRCWRIALAVVLTLGVMLSLMIGPMWDETATNDETVFLGAGYSYWQGHRYYLNAEHPPLMQLWSALPLNFMSVHPPENAGIYFDQTFPSPVAMTWDYHVEPRAKLVPASEPYYHYPAVEAGHFGRALVYGGQPRSERGKNDAERLLFWGRFMQGLVTLATGLLVFLWAKSLSNASGGLLALVAWAFNPLALAYGHLVITDPGISLTLPLALWMFTRFLKGPSLRTAVVAGLAFGLAFLTKYTAILLVPICVVLAVIFVWQQRHGLPSLRGSGLPRRFTPTRSGLSGLAILCTLVGVVCYLTVLLVYFPHWSSPPPISPEDAARLNVPHWFAVLRPILIPRDYFKGMTIMFMHVRSGHNGYLLGQWSDKGWWYYYPVAILVKTPIPLLLLMGLSVVLALRRVRSLTFAESAPLIGAIVYLGCAMTSKANIGIRHVLPIFPLLAVVVGVQAARSSRPIRIVTWVLCGWLVFVAFRAHPYYIAYFNELVGGPANGQNYLVDSNFDWGQDGKRLKQWMAANNVEHVYLDYFGTGVAIEYHKIPNTRVTPDQARQLRNGWLVVSATRLMYPEYAWLRERAPAARVAHTLFVYRLSGE